MVQGLAPYDAAVTIQAFERGNQIRRKTRAEQFVELTEDHKQQQQHPVQQHSVQQRTPREFPAMGRSAMASPRQMGSPQPPVATSPQPVEPTVSQSLSPDDLARSTCTSYIEPECQIVLLPFHLAT